MTQSFRELLITNFGLQSGGYTGSQGAAGFVGSAGIGFTGSSAAGTIPIGTTAERPASPDNGTIRINSTTLKLETYYNGVWFNIASLSPTFSAEMLIVAGGGAGGAGGGGGAGGLLYYGADSVTNRANTNGTARTLTKGTTYIVTIGAGGTVAGGSNAADVALQGANTTVTGTGIAITAIGGGAGGTSVTTFGGGAAGTGLKGANGGSGGGGGGNNLGDGFVIPGGVGTGSTTTDRQGYNGGTCPSVGNSPAGGGGGAGAGGGNGAPGTSGNGGAGLQYSIGGTATWYAGGGGGGGYNVTRGTGGSGVGGTGGLDFNSTNSTPGVVNTGSGGGGTGAGGLGGSGVVIIKYASESPFGTGGTISSISSAGTTYQIHTFTSSGTLVL